MISTKHLVKLSVISTLFLFSNPILAAGAIVGQITYGPLTATPIPTMSGTMLIVLSLLMATFGYRLVRQKENDTSRKLILSLIGLGTLAFSMTGVKLINDVQAVGYPTAPQSLVTNSGSADIYDNTFNVYTNDTGSAILIKTKVTNPGKCTVVQPDDPVIPECAAGTTTLENGEKCRVACVSPLPDSA